MTRPTRQRRGAQTKQRNDADQRPQGDTEEWWTRLGRDSPRTARRLAACAVVACAAALASAAAAPAQDSPLHLTEVVDDTFTDSQCGFPVTVHTFADLHHTVFFDAEGNVDRMITSVSQAETTLSANGVVLRSAGAGATITEFKPEGGAELATTHGLTANFVVPGAGPVWVEAGRIVYLFAPRRPIFIAGVRILDGQALCTALAG